MKRDELETELTKAAEDGMDLALKHGVGLLRDIVARLAWEMPKAGVSVDYIRGIHDAADALEKFKDAPRRQEKL